ncbi:MAG: hypothetical protein DRG25_03080 [Deltaproteobacteria bacterium]|nr:MAG: hypothetical protein DRG25_03080 [Deltaproteobacteria bacterium]
MKGEKRVKDLLIPLSDYPHLPFWATLKEALIQLSSSSESGMNMVLVFNEAYRLVGILTQVDILWGIEPKFARHYEDGVPVFWSDLLTQSARKRIMQPIKELMTPTKVTVDSNDSIMKASHIMLIENQDILAVKEDDRIVGVIRLEDIFREVIELLVELEG